MTEYAVLDIVVKRLHAVDALGAALYSAVLSLLFRLHQATFVEGQTIATLSAMTMSFAINNFHRVRQLLGSRWPHG
jgi:hypothetical protein